MTLRPAPKSLMNARKGEVTFLIFGASVFALGIAAASAVCVVCAYPAIVAVGG
ncbi:hypothetical protein ACXR2W_10595 [Leucobacter sp. HY1908]